MRLTWTPVLALWIASAVGCDRSAPAPAPASPAPDPIKALPPVDVAPTTDVAPTATRTDAMSELGRLDSRRPVPLLPMMAWHQKQNMQEHLVAIQRITDALAREDWDAVRTAAAAIGTSPEMQRMCNHMGAGVDGFTEVALDFHRRADGIADAVATKNVSAVLRATSATLQACIGCHATYRQEVVDAATWSQVTGMTGLPTHGTGR